MLDYKQHILGESMYNTPSVFAVYVSMLTLEWLKELGGIAAIETLNEKKAQLLYSEIDLNPVFQGFAAPEDRSFMNVTFTLSDERLKDEFDAMCKEAGIIGLPGHRSVGGYRASMYNALPLESVGVLVDVMSEMERKG
jgi:phosphoserine aminotransferase